MSKAEVQHNGAQLSYPPARRTVLAVFRLERKGAERRVWCPP